MPSEPPPNPSKPPLTDSPWFWLFLFGLAGVAALAAIGPKYVRRQAKIEQQYYAREEILRRQVERPAEAGAKRAEDKAAPGRGELLIPLWPVVAVLLGLLLAASGVWAVFGRERRTTNHPELSEHESS